MIVSIISTLWHAAHRYLHILRHGGGIDQEIFNEMKALQELRFHFRDKHSPYQYATSLSMGLNGAYEDRDLLLGMYNVPQARGYYFYYLIYNFNCAYTHCKND